MEKSTLQCCDKKWLNRIGVEARLTKNAQIKVFLIYDANISR